jgi:UDP-GlcNAc:undecaprenyl-phosphate GlcNAc-1-phosphate transferase
MAITILLLTIVSLVVSLSLTPVTRLLAFRLNLVDLPDNKRKIHKKPIPRLGGIPIVLAYFGACFAGAAFLTHNHVAAHNGFAATRAIAPAAILVFLVGLIDDVVGLKPWHKLAVEIVAALTVIGGGVRIHDISAFSLHPVLSVACTVVWLIACTNALNLIDGMDGLAAGIALLATMTTSIASLLSGHIELTIATAPLVGALLGFLVFNFNPASIFLGDSGSLTLGFLLGCYSVLWSEESATVVGMTAPLIALAVPLLDTTLAIVRRFLRAKPIFQPDRSHIHHRLLARGLTHRRAVLLLYMAASIAGGLSLSLIWARNHWEAVIIVAFAVGSIVGIRQLGYEEFEAARQLILRGGFRRELNAQLALKSFEADLSAAITAEDCWTIVKHASKDFGFESIRMQLAGRRFDEENGPSSTPSWAIRIPISKTDWINLSPEFGLMPHTTVVAPFANVIRKVLVNKRDNLAHPETQTETFSTAVYEPIAPSPALGFFMAGAERTEDESLLSSN